MEGVSKHAPGAHRIKLFKSSYSIVLMHIYEENIQRYYLAYLEVKIIIC